MSEKDVTFNELIEILKEVKYYCKNKGTCFNCALRKKHFISGINICMIRGIPACWEIDESEGEKMSDTDLFKAIKEYEQKGREITYTELLQRIEGLEHTVMLLEKLYNNASKEIELLKRKVDEMILNSCKYE